MKRLALFLIISVFITMYVSGPVVALTDEQRAYYAANDILYYDDSDIDPCGLEIASGTLDEKIAQYFLGQGFSKEQVAGIMGNIRQESGGWPLRATRDSTWGIFQWMDGRLTNVTNAMNAAGLGEYTVSHSEYWAAGSDASKAIPEDVLNKILQVQLDFAMSEDRSDWKGKLKTANTPELAAEIFLVLFEGAIGGSSPIQYYTPKIGVNYQETGARRSYATEALLWIEGLDGSNPCRSGTGVTLESAKIMADYKNSDAGTGNNYGAFAGTPPKANCTLFVGWFIATKTSLKISINGNTGNGGDTASFISRANNLPLEHKPRPGSVFSKHSDGSGHTGLVLSVDADGIGFTAIDSAWNTWEIRDNNHYIADPASSWDFVYIGGHITDSAIKGIGG